MAHTRFVIGASVVVALVLAIVFARPATAHPLDLGYLTIEPTGDRASVRLDLDVDASAIVLGIPPQTVDAATVEQRADALARGSFAKAPIVSASGSCVWEAGARATLAGRTVSIHATAQCPSPPPWRWTFPIVSEASIAPRFQLVVKETVARSERLTLVDRGAPELEISASGDSSVGFGRVVWSGVEHIGVAPQAWRAPDGGAQLPDGLDHILFLLALMLGGGTLLQLVGIATGFTLGHSITLALAATGIVQPPASIIEPLIALSIALAAAEAYVGKLQRRRWLLAAAFGLVHGFGFASALSHLELATGGKLLALFGYNLGIELGQVVLVLVFAPLVIQLHRRVRHGKIATRVVAGAIFACGLYWFVARLWS